MGGAGNASAYAMHDRSMGAAGIQYGSQNRRIVTRNVTDSFAFDRYGNGIWVVGVVRFARQHDRIARLHVA